MKVHSETFSPIYSPKPGKSKIPALDREPPTTKYTLRCDLFEGSELQASGDVSIEVTIGNEKIEGKKSKSEVFISDFSLIG